MRPIRELQLNSFCDHSQNILPFRELDDVTARPSGNSLDIATGAPARPNSDQFLLPQPASLRCIASPAVIGTNSRKMETTQSASRSNRIAANTPSAVTHGNGNVDTHGDRRDHLQGLDDGEDCRPQKRARQLVFGAAEVQSAGSQVAPTPVARRTPRLQLPRRAVHRPLAASSSSPSP